MGKRGPPKTPTQLMLVKGNPGKRALPKNEPKPPTSAPEPPADLGADGKVEWRRIVQRLADLGLMSDLDVGALTSYCDAFDDWTVARRAFAPIQAKMPMTGGFMVRTTNGNVVQHPLVSVIRQARADMVRFAGEFGMTPSARAGMDINVGATPADPAGKPAKPDYYG